MTIFDKVASALANDRDVEATYRNLSPGDRSILALMLENDAASGVTVAGSPNAKFWECIGKHGWMVEDHDLDFPQMPMLKYTVTDEGFRAIPVVMGILDQDAHA
ncbi:hypothetical protein [Erythrobacter sp. WG]|uniref:hypothetical protein n=1 Tax=Erythrobacter sp. WG TaxID=2985510 RepID=UPI00226E2124|nr:hypothetical protein [Erythrobacter sp. WG]MCX9145834.1 hypothetical protein [Erythrobacter sp. WG]